MSSPTSSFTTQSYRDRDGFIVVENNIARRYVQQSYASHYDQLMLSGLYTHLVEKKLLIPHVEISVIGNSEFYKIIEPEFIAFISYPYEWTFDQWKEVALKTLEINSVAMRYGMILKDASPFNFTWHKGKCVFIDTLSFEKYQTGAAWTAYRQFCESILGPIALISYYGATWASLFQSSINGWNLPFISKALPTKTWLNKCLFLHIHLHSKTNSNQTAGHLKINMDAEKLLALWKMLVKGIEKLNDHSISKNWSNYYEETILSQDYIQEKTKVLNTWLNTVAGGKLIDLGANTGKFSFLASPYFEQVIAVESDIDCLKLIQKQINDNSISNIVSVWADLTQPSAGLGWNNEERTNLITRLHSDCLFALALIHHLCIAKNIRLEMIAGLFSSLTNKWAIVEFVPKEDPKVISMLENRKDVFDDYTQERFLQSFDNYFHLRASISLQHSLRKLYLWEKK